MLTSKNLIRLRVRTVKYRMLEVHKDGSQFSVKITLSNLRVAASWLAYSTAEENPKTRLAVTIAQFSSNDQLHYVYRACAFKRGERMCWKSVERLSGYSCGRRLNIDADHVCGEHGWEWTWFFHVKLRDGSVADVPLMELPRYIVFQAGSEFFEISAGEFASWTSPEKSTFLGKKSKEVAEDWEVCIEARPNDSFRDAKVTYFSRFLNCMDNLSAVIEVEQKLSEQLCMDAHLVGTAECAVRALHECRMKIDNSLGLFDHLCEQVYVIRAEIEEVKTIIDETDRAVQDIVSLVESQR
ncbi:hypothetical protein R1sor_004368 [Riccia sorocarpa]|uniref:MATH domain-containing protein n=1 Tax=Riccia sorocarpa TaxID=122646 RepID=A0ABD3HK08_9MARC